MTTNQEAYKKVWLAVSFLLVVYKMNNTYLIVDSILESIRYKVLKKQASSLFFNETIGGFCMDLFKTSLAHPDAWMALRSGYLSPLLLFPLKCLRRSQRCSINFGPLEGERTLRDRCPVSSRCGFCFLLNLSSMPLYNSLSAFHWNPACRVRSGEGPCSTWTIRSMRAEF